MSSTATNCREMDVANGCFLLGDTSSCLSCNDSGDETYCNGYTTLECQMAPTYDTTTIDAEIPWISIETQTSEQIVGRDIIFTSNRAFDVSAVEYYTNSYMNNFTFTSSAPETTLSWTWTNGSNYMYFYYPNMTVAEQPFAFPTFSPTRMPNSHAPTRLPTTSSERCDSACPTDCPNGYTTAYTMNGCTVYCENKPTNGQCMVGGTGCSSSCRSISVGAIIGIVVGCVAFVILLIVGGVCYCKRTRKAPMTQQENEMPSTSA